MLRMRLKRDRERLDRVFTVLVIACVLSMVLALVWAGSHISPVLTSIFAVVTIALIITVITVPPALCVLWDVDQPKLGQVWTDKQRRWILELDEQGKVALVARLAQTNRISLADLTDFTYGIAHVLQSMENYSRFPPLDEDSP